MVMRAVSLIKSIALLPAYVTDELILSYKFVHRDFSTSVYPPAIFTIAALRTQPSLDTRSILLTCAAGLLYFWLYIYVFCLSNQIAGVAEDRVNKPDRPLVAGDASVRGALVRLAVVCVLFPLLGALLGVGRWAVLWEILALLHNFGGWAKHWVTKGLVMSLGTLAQLAAAWEIAAPLQGPGWRWIIVISILIFPTVPVQDLRDIAGDRLVKRKTLPLALGERSARYVLSMVYFFLPAAVYVGLFIGYEWSFSFISLNIVLGVLSWVIAVRLLACRSARADHKTYMLYTYWYCAILVGAILLL